jgi:hypothetical protein
MFRPCSSSSVGKFPIRLDIYSLTGPDKDAPATVIEVMQDQWTVEAHGVVDRIEFMAHDYATDIRVIAGAIVALLGVIFWWKRPKKADDEGEEGGKGGSE